MANLIERDVKSDGVYGKPVYEDDGSCAHVSWCPCYGCHVERTFYVCWNCGKDCRRDTPHACDTEVA